MAARKPKAELVALDIHPELRAIIDLEKERIRSADLRTQAALKWVEASDAADSRQYEYQMAKLDKDHADRTSRFEFGKNFVRGTSLAVVVITAIILYLAFWGETDQSQIALQFLKTILTALAGWGIFAGLIRLIRNIFGSQ